MPRLFASLLLLLCPLLVQADEVIRVYNWNDYIAPEVLGDFERDTGIRVEYHTFSTAEELNQALRAGAAIDVAVPSHNHLAQLNGERLLQPQVAARITSATLYPSGNVAAAALLAPELRSQPGFYPDQATKRRLFAMQPAPEKAAQALREVWAQQRPGD